MERTPNNFTSTQNANHATSNVILNRSIVIISSGVLIKYNIFHSQGFLKSIFIRIFTIESTIPV